MALSSTQFDDNTVDLNDRVNKVSETNHYHPNHNSGAVSWGAILAGATATMTLSLILMILGTGLGLSSISPWSQSGVSASAIGISTIIWITFTQITASGMGGFLAGRLRTKWIATHSDEVYFRDTAHGFLSWAVASLVTAALLTSVISAIVGNTVQAGASIAGNVATGIVAKADLGDNSTDYFIDSLFRKDVNASANLPVAGNAANPNAEILSIFAKATAAGTLPADDVNYVAQVVAQRTGISQADAELRVTNIYNKMQTELNKAKKTAADSIDQARKVTAYASLWLFVSLLVGAFTASLAATWGGRYRNV